MTLNALLMLSTGQSPHPLEEVVWHVAKCKSQGWTEMVFTKVVNGLAPSLSIVAFYGDAALDNRLLAYGTFDSFRRIDPDGDEAESIDLYAGGNYPPSAKGIVRLTDMRLAPADATLDLLGGELASNGRPLTRENLPKSPARGLVYYRVKAVHDVTVRGRESVQRSADPHMRRAQRVLAMVHELHKRGYQQLRIAPGMNSSGTAWRCFITPKRNIKRSHGALAVHVDAEGPHYTTAMRAKYFEWEDARNDTARDLADKFIRRFPKVASDGLGSDWEYVGWYVEMLGHAEAGHLPIAYADWYETQPLDSLPTLGHDPRRLPMPPGGEGEEPVVE